MDKEQAEKYLKKKGVTVNKKNIDEVMKKGKIYGDPLAIVE